METVDQVRILLIEDNPLDAELTLYGLKESKLANPVIWIQDGLAALDYIFCRGEYEGRSDGPPGLILLDLKMPRIDGAEVLARLKADERARRIPVVIMTSSREGIDITKSYDLGANSYIVKPVDFEGISSVAKQLGFYWLVLNRRSDR